MLNINNNYFLLGLCTGPFRGFEDIHFEAITQNYLESHQRGGIFGGKKGMLESKLLHNKHPITRDVLVPELEQSLLLSGLYKKTKDRNVKKKKKMLTT